MKEEQLIEDIISEGEGEQLEFKESIRKEEIAKVLCSFLNNKGGRILVGVSGTGAVKGIANAAKHLEQLKIYILKAIVPESPITISIEYVRSKEILMLKVFGGSKQPYVFDGGIYYRQKDRTVKATSKQIAELIHGRQQSEQHWERKPAIGVELDDLDKKLILSTIRESRDNHRGNYTGENITDFLSQYGLFQNGSFTNACVVLFAKHPARYIPQIRVRLTEYSEGKTDRALLRDEIFEDNLFLIRDRLEQYVNGLGVRSIFADNKWKRIDFKFPEKALQEGIINALMHRDYSSPSSTVSISVYPDSFVISNSGHLPDGMKVGELKKDHRSHPVNPDITHIVFLRGLIDKLGRGTIKLVEDCRNSGLKDPVWKDSIDGVSLTFSGPKALSVKRSESVGVNVGVNGGLSAEVNVGVNKLIDDGVNEGLTDELNKAIREEIAKIIQSVVENEGIKTIDIATKRGKSTRTIERYLKLAKALNIIEFEGAPKTGGYYLTKVGRSKIKALK